MRDRLLALVLVAAVTATAMGDMASPKLAKYEKPVDEAIERALAYLAKNQMPGDPPVARPGQKGRPAGQGGSFRGSDEGSTGISSLCVMAFLAKGYTPGVGPYGEVINRGIDFVVSQQQDSGLVLGGRGARGPMYSHGIATLMLSEVSGMVDAERQKRVDEALRKALKLILSSQRVRKREKKDLGGWRYQSSSDDADISCTGWQIMALRSARNNGAPVPEEAIKLGLAFLMRCRSSSGGFCYQAGNQPGAARAPGLGRTGTALLCLELCGMHGEKVTLDAGDWLLSSIGDRARKGKQAIDDRHFFYATYYGTQGMFQLGGDYWEKWAAVMYPQLLGMQQRDGSWTGRISSTYSTAMTILAMSVVYRQLPIYQR